MHNRSLKYCVQGLQNVELAYHGWLLFILKQSCGNKRRIETSNRKIKKAEIANNLQRTQPVSVPAPFGFTKAYMPKIPNAFQILVVTYTLFLEFKRLAFCHFTHFDTSSCLNFKENIKSCGTVLIFSQHIHYVMLFWSVSDQIHAKKDISQ